MEEEQAQDPDREHRPEEEPGTDHVALVRHRPDQDLGQPEPEEEPIVLGGLGEEVLDELEVDQPVAQARR